ncbi:hypothetical protein D3C85_1169740 [compost metagenome]
MDDGAGYVGDDGGHFLGEGCAQQQHQFTAARLAADGDEVVLGLNLFAQPAQAGLEVFQRGVRDVVGQARRFEVRQRKGGVAAGRIQRRARFVDAAARAVQDHDGGVRTGLAACRQVQRADQTFFADLVARDAVQRQALRERGLCLHAGFNPAHTRNHISNQGIGHRVVEVFAAGRVHRGLRPDQAHGRQAGVVARDRRVAGQVDHAVFARRVGGVGLPQHAVAAG